MPSGKNAVDCGVCPDLSAYERYRKAEAVVIFTLIAYDRNVSIYDDTNAFSSQCNRYECTVVRCWRYCNRNRSWSNKNQVLKKTSLV